MGPVLKTFTNAGLVAPEVAIRHFVRSLNPGLRQQMDAVIDARALGKPLTWAEAVEEATRRHINSSSSRMIDKFIAPSSRPATSPAPSSRPAPAPGPRPSSRQPPSPSLYCAWHKTHGHNTDDCQEMQRQLQLLNSRPTAAPAPRPSRPSALAAMSPRFQQQTARLPAARQPARPPAASRSFIGKPCPCERGGHSIDDCSTGGMKREQWELLSDAEQRSRATKRPAGPAVYATSPRVRFPDHPQAMVSVSPHPAQPASAPLTTGTPPTAASPTMDAPVDRLSPAFIAMELAKLEAEVTILKATLAGSSPGAASPQALAVTPGLVSNRIAQYRAQSGSGFPTGSPKNRPLSFRLRPVTLHEPNTIAAVPAIVPAAPAPSQMPAPVHMPAAQSLPSIPEPNTTAACVPPVVPATSATSQMPAPIQMHAAQSLPGTTSEIAPPLVAPAPTVPSPSIASEMPRIERVPLGGPICIPPPSPVSPGPGGVGGPPSPPLPSLTGPHIAPTAAPNEEPLEPIALEAAAQGAPAVGPKLEEPSLPSLGAAAAGPWVEEASPGDPTMGPRLEDRPQPPPTAASRPLPAGTLTASPARPALEPITLRSEDGSTTVEHMLLTRKDLPSKAAAVSLAAYNDRVELPQPSYILPVSSAVPAADTMVVSPRGTDINLDPTILVDSGCDYVCIRKQFCDRLGLHYDRSRPELSQAGGNAPAVGFLLDALDLTFKRGTDYEFILAVAGRFGPVHVMDNDSAPWDMILGQSVLLIVGAYVDPLQGPAGWLIYRPYWQSRADKVFTAHFPLSYGAPQHGSPRLDLLQLLLFMHRPA